MTDPKRKTPEDVRRAFEDGTILDASRPGLEQLLLANAQEQILSDKNRARAAEMGETMRQLLAARQSQEMHRQATCFAIIALVVAVVSLLCSAMDAYYSYVSIQRGNAQPPFATPVPAAR